MARLTPVQRHQLKVSAAADTAAGATTASQRAMQWLHTQRALLSALQSRQAREAHKAQVLPEIEPYLREVINNDTGTADPVVSYGTVWALDASHWQLALDLGEYVIAHGIAMPDEFQRNAATLIVDLMADAALAGRMQRADVDDYINAALSITKEANMPDQTRAKAHKAIAYGLAGKTTLAGQAGSWAGLTAANLSMALDHLTIAEQLDQNAGVKKDIAAVQKLLAKAEQQAKADPPAAATNTTDTTTAEAAAKTTASEAVASGKPAANKATTKATTKAPTRTSRRASKAA